MSARSLVRSVRRRTRAILDTAGRNTGRNRIQSASLSKRHKANLPARIEQAKRIKAARKYGNIRRYSKSQHS